MERFKTKSQFTFNSLFIKTLVLFSLSAPCLAAQEAPVTSAPTQEMFTLTRPVNFRWSGPYLGGYIGGAWGSSKVTTTGGSASPTSYFPSSADLNAVTKNGSQTFTPSAFIGGVQVGDNWMYKNFVYGFVLDYGSLNFSENSSVTNSTYPDGSGNYSINTSISTDWMYTVRGRLGWTTELPWPVMIYGTGGLAVTKLKVSNQFSDTTSLAGAGMNHNSNTINGWCVGLGVEFPITQHLTVNGEYLYTNFGSVKTQSSVYNTTAGFGVDANSLTSPLSTTAQLYASFLKVGLNYKFDVSA